MSRDQKFNDEAAALGHSFDREIKPGGSYAPLVRDGCQLYVSGQVPRVGDTVMVTGTVGTETSLAQAQVAARICAMRGLALIKQALGSLEQVAAMPRINVFVRSSPEFTQQSEVADAASQLIHRVLGPVGVHARTSVGVLQLPKGASVEIDFLATALPAP